MMMPEKNDMILADQQYFSMDCRKTQRNNNVLVVGCSGAGKTRSIVTPNLLQASGSYIISDPKGNLYAQYRNYLLGQGYVVKCLDFVHPERSIGYNPLQYIHTTQDIVKVANMLVYQRKQASHSDPFWEESGAVLMAALIGYLMETSVRESDRRIRDVLSLLCLGRRSGSTVRCSSPLERRFLEHGLDEPDSWACRQFDKVCMAPDKTWDCILLTLTSKLGMLESREMDHLLGTDRVDIPSIGRRKTALFVVVSDTDRSMDNLANLFFTQAMNELCLYADEFCDDCCLPVPVRFILDDFATNCHIDEFPRMIASIRSRGLSAMLMVQAESQLEEGYGADGRTIIGNCDSYVYLGGNDIATAAAVGERCDLPMQKILNMPVGCSWVFRRGCRPSYGRNFDLEAYLKARNIVPDKRKNSRKAYPEEPFIFVPSSGLPGEWTEKGRKTDGRWGAGKMLDRKGSA